MCVCAPTLTPFSTRNHVSKKLFVIFVWWMRAFNFLFFIHRILSIRLKNHMKMRFSFWLCKLKWNVYVCAVQQSPQLHYYAICTLQMAWHAMQKRNVLALGKKMFYWKRSRVCGKLRKSKVIVCVVGKTFNHFICCLGHRLSIKINQKLLNEISKKRNDFTAKLITHNHL